MERSTSTPKGSPREQGFYYNYHTGKWARPVLAGTYVLYTTSQKLVGYEGYIKIGKAGDVLKRRNDLQVGCPTRLFVWGIGRSVNESSAHVMLKEMGYHHRGEWFYYEQSIRFLLEHFWYLDDYDGSLIDVSHLADDNANCCNDTLLWKFRKPQ